ncbi:hypothetical protein ABZ896_37150 [Streptomyces sp. NPDC047072]|uniref:hypothetical protein n=1 Tax=Streptomyces sp. NPDC047072 TaxID=3154809 RepID=UPI0033C3E546
MSLTWIVLSSGRSLDLTEVRMSSTYGGMLEGYPCKPVNEWKIQGLVHRAGTASPTTPVHLVPPPRAYPEDDHVGAFGPVEILPAVSCMGFFSSTPIDPDLDPVLHRSALTVVWFQPTPEVPSESAAEQALLDLAWDELAKDHEL